MTDFFKCESCGKMVKIIYEGTGDLACCGKSMKMLSEFGSTEEILDYAIEKEEEAHQFYLDWSKKIESENMQELFSSFADEELKHKEKLLRVKSGGTFKPSSQKITDLKIVDYLVDITPTPEMDYQEALIVAMKREKASFRLYSDLAAMSESDTMHELFTALAQEEAKHKLRLETEYEKDIYSEN